MKKIVFFLLTILTFSCREEEESITFHIMEQGYYTDVDYLSIDYSVIAPGRVNIEDHGVEYKDFLDSDSGRFSFGPLNKPGNYHNYVDFLQPSTSYYFRLYAIANGKRYTSKEFVSSTLSMP